MANNGQAVETADIERKVAHIIQIKLYEDGGIDIESEPALHALALIGLLRILERRLLNA